MIITKNNCYYIYFIYYLKKKRKNPEQCMHATTKLLLTALSLVFTKHNLTEKNIITKK